jgi:hypothetical protein
MRPVPIWGFVLVLGTLAAAPALGDRFWVEYEPANGNYPEQEGWTRYILYGGAQRSIVDGALVLDSRAYPGIEDYVKMFRPGAMDPGPSETFVMEWRLKVLEVVPRDYYDVAVGAFSDEAWGVGFEFGLDFVRSVFENEVVATFSPYVFHDFQLVSTDMRNYALYIDGQQMASGVFIHVVGPSEVGWGDGIPGVTSLTRWDYFRFGVVLAPHAGDVNCDGTVDFADINPFVLALTDDAAYQETYPGCWPENADINEDGSVDFGDINPFVVLLTSV